MRPPTLRIGHAYGNTRRDIDLARAAGVDSIECDLWYRNENIYVRHDRRLSPLPLLADRKMPGHPLPPYSIPLFKGYYVRPEVNSLKLPELLRRTEGGPRLLLDVKGVGNDTYAERFATALASAIREHDAVSRVDVCGQLWPVLTQLHANAPEMHVRFSIERPDQWSAFVTMTKGEAKAHDVCIQHRFLSEEKLHFLKEHESAIYAWTVDRPSVARELVDRGIDGIISNNLRLLSSLAVSEKPGSGARPSP